MDLSGPPPFNQASGLPLETSIFIVGASVFGLSSAYHLALSGYKNITVFDRADSIPSPYAASNDLNKIIRAEYGVGHGTDDFYTELALVSFSTPDTTLWRREYTLHPMGRKTTRTTELNHCTGSNRSLVLTRMGIMFSKDGLHPPRQRQNEARSDQERF